MTQDFKENSDMDQVSRTDSLFRGVWHAIRSTAFVFLIALCVSMQANAQSESGKVVGTVIDQTGAVVSGATLTLANKENGLVLTVTSNSSGELNLPAVPRGDYTAKISAPGFSSQVQSVTVTVTEVQDLLFKLTPGSITSSIVVTSAAPLVNTSDPTLGETIESKQITELPLNGRNALNLALLAPGVTTGSYVEYGQDTINRFIDSGGGQLSANGTRSQANNFILDGVDNNDGLQNIIVFFPPVDATEEFKVNTNVAPAQYGRAGGVFLISSIKSGTNAFHGSAFNFNRSGKWAGNPNYQFLGASPTANPPFRRDQFGGSVGGPFLKNKLFGFGDYQATRSANPTGSGFDTVPTPLMRTGNFTELLNPALTGGSFITTFPHFYPNAGKLNQNLGANSKGYIYDPETCNATNTTCTPFAAGGQVNIVPAGRQNQAALNYFKAFPMPSRTDRVLNNYQFATSTGYNFNTFDVRLDWNRTPQDQYFARMSYDSSANYNKSELPQVSGEPALSVSGNTNYTHGRGWVLGSTHTFSPTIVNEGRIAYTRDNYGFQPSNIGDNVAKDLGMIYAPGLAGAGGGPIIGGYNTEIRYSGDYGLFATPQNTDEVTDTINFIRGAHSISTGGTFLRRQVEFFRPISGKGFFTVAGNGADFTGYEVSDLLAAFVDNYAIGGQNGYFAEISQEDGVFVQDNWRFNKRLTLNLGARWDLMTWPYEAHNQNAAFNVQTGHVMLADQNGVSRSIINQDYTNFAPRVGFAYDLFGDGKTALHGGYGIFYFPDYGGIGNQLGQQQPFGGAQTFSTNAGYCIALTGIANPGGTPGTPYSCPYTANAAAPYNGQPSPAFVNFNVDNPPGTYGSLAVNPNNNHSMIQQWNLQLERQLGGNNVIGLAYVGTHASRLSTYYNYNIYTIGSTTKPFPSLQGITLDDYNGSSNYNGLQAHVEHRGVYFTATGSYAWSHALDNSAGAYGGTGVGLQLLYNNQKANYGSADQDQRHVFSGSLVGYLPFGRGKKFAANAPRALDAVIGGWQFNNILLLQTGQPVDIAAAGGANPGNRPDLVKPLSYPKSVSGTWFDKSSFSSANLPITQATDGSGNYVYTRVGALGRNGVVGPGYRTDNIGVQKNIQILEGKILELHGDAFNVTNTPNFEQPDNSEQDGTFGQVRSLHGTPRQIQLAARFTF
ncbi:MAG: carboxypeptidase regulatory-like domain-containing protein [Terracidiphilus sp.]